MEAAGNVRKKASTEISFADYGNYYSDGEEPTEINRRVINFQDPLDAMSLNTERNRVVVAGMRGVLQIIKVLTSEQDTTDGPSIVQDIDLRAYRRGKVNILYSANNVSWNKKLDQYVSTTSSNGAIVVWNVVRRNKNVFKSHERSATCLDWNSEDPYTVISGSRDCRVYSYDIRTPGEHTQIFVDGTCEAVRDLEFVKHPGYEHFFFTGDDSGALRLWDLRMSKRFVMQRTAHNGFVSTITLNPNNRQLLATGGGRDKIVKIWNWKEDRIDRKFVVETMAPLGRCMWRPDHQFQIATCASVNDMNVHVWDIRRPFIPYATYEEHRDSVTDGCWPAADVDCFMSCGKDGLLVLHSIDSGHKPLSYACDVPFDITPDGLLGIAVNTELQLKVISEMEPIPISAKQGADFKFSRKRKIPYESFKGPIKSLITVGLPDAAKISLPPDDFYELARKYQLGGKKLNRICNHNAKIAKKLGKEHIYQTWRLVDALIAQANLQKIYDEDDRLYEQDYQKKWEILKKEMDERRQPVLPTALEMIEYNTRKILINKVENSKYANEVLHPSENELSNHSTSSDESSSDEDVVEEVDVEGKNKNEINKGMEKGDVIKKWREEKMVDKNGEEIIMDETMTKRKKKKKKKTNHVTMMDFYFGGGESNYKDCGKKKEILFRNEFMGLRNEAFELRKMFSESKQCEAEQLNRPRTEEELKEWSPMSEIRRILIFHAEQGDVQTCSSIAIVCGRKLFDVLDTYTVEAWIYSYIDMCDRLELFTTIARIKKYCYIYRINSMSREGTYFEVAHSKCRKMIKFGRCTKCEMVISPICVLCRCHVHGLLFQCHKCHHSLHPNHALQWFENHEFCAAPSCLCKCRMSSYPRFNSYFRANFSNPLTTKQLSKVSGRENNQILGYGIETECEVDRKIDYNVDELKIVNKITKSNGSRKRMWVEEMNHLLRKTNRKYSKIRKIQKEEVKVEEDEEEEDEDNFLEESEEEVFAEIKEKKEIKNQKTIDELILEMKQREEQILTESDEDEQFIEESELEEHLFKKRKTNEKPEIKDEILEKTGKNESIFEEKKIEDKNLEENKKDESILQESKKEEKVAEESEKDEAVLEETEEDESISEETKEDESISEEAEEDESILEEEDESISEEEEEDESILEESDEEESILKESEEDESISEEDEEGESIFEEEEEDESLPEESRKDEKNPEDHRKDERILKENEKDNKVLEEYDEDEEFLEECDEDEEILEDYKKDSEILEKTEENQRIREKEEEEEEYGDDNDEDGGDDDGIEEEESEKINLIEILSKTDETPKNVKKIFNSLGKSSSEMTEKPVLVKMKRKQKKKKKKEKKKKLALNADEEEIHRKVNEEKLSISTMAKATIENFIEDKCEVGEVLQFAKMIRIGDEDDDEESDESSEDEERNVLNLLDYALPANFDFNQRQWLNILEPKHFMTEKKAKMRQRIEEKEKKRKTEIEQLLGLPSNIKFIIKFKKIDEDDIEDLKEMKRMLEENNQNVPSGLKLDKFSLNSSPSSTSSSEEEEFEGAELKKKRSFARQTWKLKKSAVNWKEEVEIVMVRKEPSCLRKKYDVLRNPHVLNDPKEKRKAFEEFVKLYFFIPWEELKKTKDEMAIRKAYDMAQKFMKAYSQTCQNHFDDFYFRLFAGSLGARIISSFNDGICGINMVEWMKKNREWFELKPCVLLNHEVMEMFQKKKWSSKNWKASEYASEEKKYVEDYWETYGKVPIDVTTEAKIKSSLNTNDRFEFSIPSRGLKRMFELTKRRVRKSRMFDVNLRKKEIEGRNYFKNLSDLVDENRIEFKYQPIRCFKGIISLKKPHIDWPICQFEAGDKLVTIRPKFPKYYAILKSRLRRHFGDRSNYGMKIERKGTIQRLKQLQNVWNNKTPHNLSFNLIDYLKNCEKFKVFKGKLEKLSVDSNDLFKIVYGKKDEMFYKRKLDTIMEECEEELELDHCEASPYIGDIETIKEKAKSSKEKHELQFEAAQEQKYRKYIEGKETMKERERRSILSGRWIPEYQKRLREAKDVMIKGEILVRGDIEYWMYFEYFQHEKKRKMLLEKRKKRNEIIKKSVFQNWNKIDKGQQIDDEDIDSNSDYSSDYSAPTTPSDDETVSSWYDNENQFVMEELANENHADERRIIREKIKGPIANKNCLIENYENKKMNKKSGFEERNRKKIERRKERKWVYKHFRRNLDAFALNNEKKEISPFLAEIIRVLHRNELRRVSNRIIRDKKCDFLKNQLKIKEMMKMLPEKEACSEFFELIGVLFPDVFERIPKNEESNANDELKVLEKYEQFFGGETIHYIKFVNKSLVNSYCIQEAIAWFMRHCKPTKWNKMKMNKDYVNLLLNTWCFEAKDSLEGFYQILKSYKENDIKEFHKNNEKTSRLMLAETIEQYLDEVIVCECVNEMILNIETEEFKRAHPSEEGYRTDMKINNQTMKPKVFDLPEMLTYSEAIEIKRRMRKKIKKTYEIMEKRIMKKRIERNNGDENVEPLSPSMEYHLRRMIEMEVIENEKKQFQFKEEKDSQKSSTESEEESATFIVTNSNMNNDEVLESIGIPARTTANKKFVSMRSIDVPRDCSDYVTIQELQQETERKMKDLNNDWDDDSMSYSTLNDCNEYEVYFRRELPEYRAPSCVVIFSPTEFLNYHLENNILIEEKYVQMIKMIKTKEELFQLVVKERLIKNCRDEFYPIIQDKYLQNIPEKKVLKVFDNTMIIVIVDTMMKPWLIHIQETEKREKKESIDVELKRDEMLRRSMKSFEKWKKYARIDMERLSVCPILISDEKNMNKQKIDIIGDVIMDEKVMNEWSSLSKKEGIYLLDAGFKMEKQSDDRVKVLQEIFKPIYEQFYDDWKIYNETNPTGKSIYGCCDPCDIYEYRKILTMNYAHQYHRMIRYDPVLSKTKFKDFSIQFPSFREDVPSYALLSMLHESIMSFINADFVGIPPHVKAKANEQILNISKYGTDAEILDQKTLSAEEDERKQKMMKLMGFTETKVKEEYNCTNDLNWLRSKYERIDLSRKRFMANLLFEIAQQTLYNFSPKIANFAIARKKFESLLNKHARQRPLLDMMVTRIEGISGMSEETIRFLYDYELVEEESLEPIDDDLCCYEIVDDFEEGGSDDSLLSLIDEVEFIKKNRSDELVNFEENTNRIVDLQAEDDLKEHQPKPEKQRESTSNVAENVVIRLEDLELNGEKMESNPTEAENTVSKLETPEMVLRTVSFVTKSSKTSLTSSTECESSNGNTKIDLDSAVDEGDMDSVDLEAYVKENLLMGEADVRRRMAIGAAFARLAEMDKSELEKKLNKKLKTYMDRITSIIQRNCNAAHESWGPVGIDEREDIPSMLCREKEDEKDIAAQQAMFDLNYDDYDEKDPEKDGSQYF